jgi:hypothetical protein
VPTATPLYAASGDDFGDWNVPTGWSTGTGIATDGTTDPAAWVAPPVSVPDTNDYSVTFTVELGDADTCPRSFGVAIRGSSDGYIAGGFRWDCEAEALIWANQDALSATAITLEPGTHTVQLAAQGQTIELSLDGQVVLQTDTDRFPSGSEIGFWSDGVPLTISDVVVQTVPATVEKEAGDA